VFYGPAAGSILQTLFEPKLRRAEPLSSPRRMPSPTRIAWWRAPPASACRWAGRGM